MKPDYTNAFNMAYEVIYNYSPRELPIDLERLVQKLKMVKLVTYSELCSARGIDYSEAVGFLGSELGTLVRTGNRYFIYFNDRKRSPYLDRFTIAHELGHFFLNHLEEGEILAETFDKNVHDVFEKEANCFARNLLSPILLLESLLDNFEATKENIETVSRYFGVSKQAAKARLDMYLFDKAKLNEYHGESWDSFTYTPWKVCKKCSHIALADNFCKICGQDISRPTGAIHPNMLIKAPLRVYSALADISCESCNSNLYLPYETVCTNCGKDMSNYCLNKWGVHAAPYYIEDLSARYCPGCGSETRYRAKDFLKPHQKDSPQTMGRISFIKGRQEYLLKNGPDGFVREIKISHINILNFAENADL